MPEHLEDLIVEGHAALVEGRVADARQLFLDCVRQASLAADEPVLAEALCGLAQAELVIGSCDAAAHHYANATILYRRNGPPALLAETLRQQAEIARNNLQPAEAQPLYIEAEAIYRQEGEAAALDLAATLRGLALVTESLGEVKACPPLWQEARTLYAHANRQQEVAECDRQLAALAAQ